MNITYNTPVSVNIIPIPGSIVTCRFKSKANPSRIRVDIAAHIYWRKNGRNSTDVKSSNIETVYTDNEDKIHEVNLSIPQYDITKRISSVIMLYLHGPSVTFTTKAEVEDFTFTTNSEIIPKLSTIIKSPSPSQPVTKVIPEFSNTEEKVISEFSNTEEITNYLTEGYRKILIREPDPEGLSYFMKQLQIGITSKQQFYDILIASDEYKNKFSSSYWKINNKFNPIKLVNENKLLNRPWFYGLEGTWWWGKEEIEVIQTLEQIEKNPKIAIASIVRNEEHTGNLARFLDCCQDLEKYHNNIIYIFIEGDSIDKTYTVLKDFVSLRNNSILLKIDKGSPRFSKSRDMKRTTVYGELRNKLIDLILSTLDIAEILMIDASYGWKGDLISKLRETNADIAAPLNVLHKDNYGRYVFYDIWTFRKNGREFAPFYPYATDMLFDRPVDIDSAGGGYLMKRSVLEAGARFDGRHDCEHVALCNTARKMGFTIKINPTVYIRKGGYKE